ncbi:hypothetical protein G0R26_001904 [Salmonella enterica]|nr:hypothetical protein [Salmonella enterica]EBS2783981.1 hypothetical protein [Salmonella enterica subsp. enterica serovar Newport]ECM0350332.1 hypothetical protein [Salmonella enterica subsp. enterica serovar Heidelberg]EAB4945760.1 hypothetical protein [Salmonella enterica]EAM5826162.1 hypothetical protein [Salmonella enterica]
MSINKKLNFGGNMNNFADQKIAAAMQMAGKILPAEVVSQSGKMVTVTFLLRDIPYTLPQLTIPLFGPQYIRYPMQKGDNGSVIQQILPTFYVNRLQQQFSKYFSSLQIALADVDPPVYNISAITNSGSKIVAQVYV